MKVNLGIIGLGIISKYHEDGIHAAGDIVEVRGICDINLSLAKERAEPYGAEVYTDYHKLLDNPEIDTVDIILPHHLHYTVCKAALMAGKNVIIEKPFVIKSNEGWELIELAKEKGCVLSVAENTPFVEAYIQLKQILNKGELGKIYSVKTMIAGTEIHRMLNKKNWKGRSSASGGGVIMDAAPHSFYLLNWLFGDVHKLKAFTGYVIPGCEVEDNAVIAGTLNERTFFESSFSFTAQAPWTERLEVYGESGTIIIDQIMQPSSLYYRGAEDYDPVQIKSIPCDPIAWKWKSIAKGVESFIRAVYTGSELVVKPEEAVKSIELCECAYNYLKENKNK